MPRYSIPVESQIRRKLKRIRGLKRQMDVNEVNGLELIIAVA
jgi:hypothetical protein